LKKYHASIKEKNPTTTWKKVREKAPNLEKFLQGKFSISLPGYLVVPPPLTNIKVQYANKTSNVSNNIV
jgi:hypothetical protein